MKHDIRIIFFAVLFLFAASLSCFAAEAPQLPPFLAEVNCADFGAQTLSLQNEVLAASETADTFEGSYFSLLPDSAAQVYLALEEAGTQSASVTFQLSDPFGFYYDGTDVTEKNAADLQAQEMIDLGYSAFVLDHPEFFWTQGIQMAWNYQPMYSTPNGWYYTLVDFTLTFSVKDIYQEGLDELYEKLMSAVDSVRIRSGTRYQMLQQIYAYLIETVDYDLNATYGHEPVGSLLYGSAVCEGYSEAFKLLCDRFSIPCISIVGLAGQTDNYGGHMWNAVQMEDGVYYLVDATWGDSVSGASLCEDYLLAGKNSVCSALASYGTFEESHIATGLVLTSGPALSHPEFAEETYARVAGDADGDLSVTISDLTLLAQVLSGWDQVYRAVSADFNENATVALEDLTLLAQYLAGWNIA